MSNIEIIELIESDEWKNFKNYCNDKSFINQLGLFRYEDMHTNFFASLLDEKNVYGYKLEPMKLFLNLIKNKNKNYYSKIDLSKEYKITKLIINVRKSLKSGIPDLYITFNLSQNNNDVPCLILLEAKLGSDEHGQQCLDYYNEVNEYNNYEEKVFLYLTLDGRDSSAGNKYESITYQDLIDYIYTPLLDNKQVNKVVLTIEEYLKSFNAIYDFDYELNSYPVTHNMKSLVELLWNKQITQKLWKDDLWKEIYIKSPKTFRIFSICLLNSNLVDNSIKEKIRQNINKLKEKYIFKGKQISTIKLGYNVFTELIEDPNINTIEDIDERLLETTKGYKNLVPEENIMYVSNQDYYSNSYNKEEYLEINNKKYYYLRFNSNDAKYFIDALEECYPEIRKQLIIENHIN